MLLDRRGKLITEYFAEERREIVSIQDLPKYLLEAVIAKEDRSFFSHAGFSVKGTFRAAWNIIAGHYFSGGSTISQQVAGNLYEDRSVTTLGRKFSELWWSFQLEKKRSKIEILEIYLNNSQFGHGNYGVESASRFYFGHSAGELSLAEATLLTVQLSDPVSRSMINYPNRARSLQKRLLTEMVELGYVDEESAFEEFDSFWAQYEPTKASDMTTHTERTDHAPEFSELIRRRFEELFYGSPDLYRDGFVIHSGLDLDYQALAEELLEETAGRLGSDLEEEQRYRDALVTGTILPVVDLLGSLLGIDGVDFVSPVREASTAVQKTLLTPLALIDTVLGAGDLAGGMAHRMAGERAVVVGDLVAVDNTTGHILALASRRSGGITGFAEVADEAKNLGSVAGAIGYASLIEAKRITPATLIFDSPVVIIRSGNPALVVPNTRGVYLGPIAAWQAVASSLAAPLVSLAQGSVQSVHDYVALALSGAFGPPPIVPADAGLAIDGVRATPLQLAGAFATISRGGKAPALLAIRYIEDRNGIVMYDNEEAALRDSRKEPLMSEQSAFVVKDALKRTLTRGSLSRRNAEIGGLGRSDLAAVSGTTQNWSDAWTVGFSSVLTTAVWFGRAVEGETLGQFQTGASVAGPVWTRFMKSVHRDLPFKEDAIPTGVIYRTVCAVSGMLPTDACDRTEEVPFLSGTEPKVLCTYHTERREEYGRLVDRLKERFNLSPLPASVRARSPKDRTDLPGRAYGSYTGDVENQRENPFID